jgi:hypothetical protein
VWGDVSVEGLLARRWKDAIDRKFVARYRLAPRAPSLAPTT